MNDIYSIDFPYFYCFGYLLNPDPNINIKDFKFKYYVYFATHSLNEILEHINSISDFEFMNTSVKKEFVAKLKLNPEKIKKDFLNFDYSCLWKIFDIEEDLTNIIAQDFIFK